MLPIVRRELQVAARKRSLYWQRLVIGSIAALASVCFMLFAGAAPTQVGASMFSLLSWGVFIITMLDGIRCTGDSISWERREGTLGLLFLTDLRAYDIVLGKLAIATVKTLTTLVVTFPMLALPLMLGGVTPEEWARTIGTLLVAALFSLSASLFFSALSVSALAAITTSAVFLGLFMAPHIALRMFGEYTGLWLSGPLTMLSQSKAVSYSLHPDIYWKALIFSLAMSLLMLISTFWLIGRRGSFEVHTKAPAWWKRLLEPKPALAQTLSEMGAIDSPGLWLAKRTLPGSRVLWILTLTGAVLCVGIAAFAPGNGAVVGIVAIQIAFGFLVKLWLGMVAPQSLHMARTSGAMELLLCTPIRPESLIRGQLEALRAYIFPPALLVCIGYPLLSILGVILGGKNLNQIDGFAMMLVGGLFWFVIFLMDFFALAYTGLWFALTSTKIEQAITKTIGYVLILPWLLVIFPFVGWLSMLLWPIFWILWPKFKVTHRFNQRVAEQFAPPA